MYTGSGIYVVFGIILFLFSISVMFQGSAIFIFTGLLGVFFSIILFWIAKQGRLPKPKVIPRTTPVYGNNSIKCPKCVNITGTFNKTCPNCGAKLK